MIDNFRGEYRFLSNFYPSPIEMFADTGEPTEVLVVWPTAEHLYQAMKTKSWQEAKLVLNCETPGQAKRMGKKITVMENWQNLSLDAMEMIVYAKFEQNLKLQDKLLATGDEELVEGNNWGDTFWGKVDGEGENHLGRILMKVREEFKQIRQIS